MNHNSKLINQLRGHTYRYMKHWKERNKSTYQCSFLRTKGYGNGFSQGGDSLFLGLGLVHTVYQRLDLRNKINQQKESIAFDRHHACCNKGHNGVGTNSPLQISPHPFIGHASREPRCRPTVVPNRFGRQGQLACFCFQVLCEVR